MFLSQIGRLLQSTIGLTDKGVGDVSYFLRVGVREGNGKCARTRKCLYTSLRAQILTARRISAGAQAGAQSFPQYAGGLAAEGAEWLGYLDKALREWSLIAQSRH